MTHFSGGAQLTWRSEAWMHLPRKFGFSWQRQALLLLEGRAPPHLRRDRTDPGARRGGMGDSRMRTVMKLALPVGGVAVAVGSRVVGVSALAHVSCSAHRTRRSCTPCCGPPHGSPSHADPVGEARFSRPAHSQAWSPVDRRAAAGPAWCPGLCRGGAAIRRTSSRDLWLSPRPRCSRVRTGAQTAFGATSASSAEVVRARWAPAC